MTEDTLAPLLAEIRTQGFYVCNLFERTMVAEKEEGWQANLMYRRGDKSIGYAYVIAPTIPEALAAALGKAIETRAKDPAMARTPMPAPAPSPEAAPAAFDPFM